MPPPSAAPCTRAMVGFFISASVRSMPARARASLRFSAMPLLAARRIQLRSAPAEKLFPSSRQNDDADVGILVKGDAGCGEFGDQGFVEGVMQVGPVHPDRGDRAGEFDFQGLEGHLGLSPADLLVFYGCVLFDALCSASDARAYFFLFGQEKVAKKKATPRSAPAARVPCATRRWRGLRNSGLCPSDSARPLSANACVARRLPRGPANRSLPKVQRSFNRKLWQTAVFLGPPERR